MTKPKLNVKEKEVIRALYKIHRPANINEIARKTSMSWHSVKTTLRNLEEKSIVVFHHYEEDKEEKHPKKKEYKSSYYELDYSWVD